MSRTYRRTKNKNTMLFNDFDYNYFVEKLNILYGRGFKVISMDNIWKRKNKSCIYEIITYDEALEYAKSMYKKWIIRYHTDNNINIDMESLLGVDRHSYNTYGDYGQNRMRVRNKLQKIKYSDFNSDEMYGCYYDCDTEEFVDTGVECPEMDEFVIEPKRYFNTIYY